MIELKNFKIRGRKDFELNIAELRISSGQFIQIFGSNNSGKSLLLETLAGGYSHFEGEFLYNGTVTDPRLLNTILLRNQPAFLKRKTVEKNLILPFSRYTSRRKKIVNNLLKKTELIDLLKEPVYTLSRSQQKSFELVRAVVQLPHYLLIDDYDTFFDNSTLNELSSVFEYAASAGTTVLVTSRKQVSSVLIGYKIEEGKLEKL